MTQSELALIKELEATVFARNRELAAAGMCVDQLTADNLRLVRQHAEDVERIAELRRLLEIQGEGE